MPGRDRTGPLGTGPIGRGLGPCFGGDVPPVRGGFFGMGWGRGRGMRYWRYGWNHMPYMNAEGEKEALKEQQSWLTHQLEWVKNQLQENEEQSE
jgi:hypothetical protein